MPKVHPESCCLRYENLLKRPETCSGFRGSGFRVQGLGVQGLGVQGLEFRVEFRVQGLRFY